MYTLNFWKYMKWKNIGGKRVPYGGLPSRNQTTPTPQVTHPNQSPASQYLTDMSTPPRRPIPTDNIQASYSEPGTPGQTYNANTPGALPLEMRDLEEEDDYDEEEEYGIIFYLFQGIDSKEFERTLRSQLENEIEWAFEILVQLSSDETDVRKLTGIESGSILAIDNANENILVFRNVSLNDYNVKFMAGHKTLRKYLIEAHLLPEIEQLCELKHYCLETVVNISRNIRLKNSQNELITTLLKLLYSKDSLIVLLAVNSMTNLASNEYNGEIDPATVQRLLQLLLIELILAVLYWFYHFVRLLINFLRHGANDKDFLNDQRTSVLQTDIWYAYREKFMHSQSQMMPAAEVIKHVVKQL
ncbi:1679_t:CDS:2 [Diversispora eburnea]|uniref:1679_t:CDS:1 n=1 Tax=Diversispora eburnea TaxID=1213867 RepID=A0A9N8VZY1_9GLOM|nr:1679_t:CDS:2 [Diversispora eburnea]